MKHKNYEEISESMHMGVVLALTGGFLDAYTYKMRGHVFANAQTGNIVLLAKNLSEAQWFMVLEYLIPIIAFTAGVVISEIIKHRFQKNTRIHWRQMILALEILLLGMVAFFPQSKNMAANVVVSFVCAMQVEGFRRVKGNPYATTMCTGNLRSASELICSYWMTKDKEQKKKCVNYFGIIGTFIMGAFLGTIFSGWFGEKAVLACCVLLLAGFCILHFNITIIRKQTNHC